MTGDYCNRASVVTVREWNTGIGGCSHCTAATGDHLEWNPLGNQRLALLASAAKDEGITPLQPNHDPPRLSFGDQNTVDLSLGNRGFVWSFSDIDVFRV